MADIFSEMKESLARSEDNMTLTWNGAPTYEGVGDTLTDFYLAKSTMRNRPEEVVKEEFAKAYAEDPMKACKAAFLIGDVREGDGERRTFNLCMDYLAECHPQVAASLIPLVPEYTRWDNAVRLMVNPEPVVSKAASKFVEDQFKKDIEAVKRGEKASLLCKWLPHASTKKKEDGTRTEKQDLNKKIVVKLRKDLGITEKEYRLTRKNLQEHCQSYIVEMDLSAKKEIPDDKFKSVPSKANVKYHMAFERNQAAAYEAYLERVANGQEKINASVLVPHDIVHQYVESGNLFRGENKALELLWKALPDKVSDPEGKGHDTIVIRDGSGSMTHPISSHTKTTALDVSTALSIYFAERQNGELQNKFITFSNRPRIIDMSNCKSLHDKIALCLQYTDISNTDIEKTFDLLLDTYKRNGTSQENTAKNVLIISDMEFDMATTAYSWYSSNNEEAYGKTLTTMEEVQKKWKENGYELPRLIFWNVNSGRITQPLLDNEHGIITLSGYSTNNLDMVLSGEFDKEVEQEIEVVNEETGETEKQKVKETVTMTPREQLDARLSKERYDAVEKAAEIGIEKDHEDSRDILIKHPVRNADVQKTDEYEL